MDAAVEPNMMESHRAFVIYPRWTGSGWVFDDPRFDVEDEPIYKGADLLMETALSTAGIGLVEAKEDGFRLKFSNKKFEGFHDEWKRVSHADGGTWYKSHLTGQHGWLCEVLTRYMVEAPEYLYIAVARCRR